MKLPPVKKMGPEIVIEDDHSSVEDPVVNQEVRLEVSVEPNHEAFRGHFPDYPILPGVVQLDWAIRLAREYLALKNLTARDFQVKFHQVIRPGYKIILHLKEDSQRQRLSFTYSFNNAIMSSGFIRLPKTLL